MAPLIARSWFGCTGTAWLSSLLQPKRTNFRDSQFDFHFSYIGNLTVHFGLLDLMGLPIIYDRARTGGFFCGKLIDNWENERRLMHKNAKNEHKYFFLKFVHFFKNKLYRTNFA